MTSASPTAVYGSERRVVLHRGPRQMGPEIVELSDDDSDEAPVEVEEIH